MTKHKNKKKKDPYRFLPKLDLKLSTSDTTGNMYLSWDRIPDYSYAKLVFIDQLKTLPMRVEGKEDEIIKNCCWIKPPNFNLAETEVYVQAFNDENKPISKPTSTKDTAHDGLLKMEIFADKNMKLRSKKKKKYVLTC
jgi:hypothetical protein